jgi:hypothetical protein
VCPIFAFFMPYLHDIFFSAIIPLVCVFLGYKAASKSQLRIEKVREYNAGYADCTKVMVALSTMYAAIFNLQNMTKKQKGNQNRHIELHPFVVSFPFIKIDASSLIRILDMPNGNDQLMYFLNAQAWLEATLDSTQIRNEVHLEAQRTATIYPDGAEVHPGLSIQLKNLTDGLYEQIPETIARIKKSADGFTQLIKANYPGRPIREIETKLLDSEKTNQIT